MGVEHIEGKRVTHTPGDKDYLDEEVADNAISHESEAANPIMSLRDHSRLRRKSGPGGEREVRQQLIFAGGPSIHEVPDQSSTYGCHPSKFLLTGPIGQSL